MCVKFYKIEIFSFFIYFQKILQSPPAMSGRQKELPQEELEIHHVLSPSASSTDSVPPGQRHPVENQPNLPNRPVAVQQYITQLCKPNNGSFIFQC